jgi:hypothetical protein
MQRSELIEWIIIILCIVLWWPLLFGFHPVWYRLFLYVGESVALLIIFFRRLARVRAGLKYSEESLKHQPPGFPGAKP